ncbi:hypothetical protein [Legionella spiritensis]|uniref:hypothetical protein n=1 Tax=Legionella spiritensis TaxID=452 RepID=UPI000F6FE769|nr:hypothetical protein [Legionella spiritensis]VEG89832.1 Uncharacterised protein [Legionella spiritensis]
MEASANDRVFKDLIKKIYCPFEQQYTNHKEFCEDFDSNVYRCKIHLNELEFFIIKMGHLSLINYRDCPNSNVRDNFLLSQQEKLRNYLEINKFKEPFFIFFSSMN